MGERIKKVTNILTSDVLSMKKLLSFKNRNPDHDSTTIQRSSQFYSEINQTVTLNTSDGRPLNKAMIVMAGQIGSGKSTIINHLFKDEKLCEVGSHSGITTTTTKEIREYGRVLKTGMRNQAFYLSFVDVPGIISDDNIVDTANQNEEKNLALIKHFRKTHADLKSTEQVKTRTYPNLILLTVNPVNQQLVGKTSNFQKTLRCLLHCELVDLHKLNLVVVVTHAYNIRTEENRKVRQNIQAALLDEIKISAGIPIVFLENKPGKHASSHFNLIEAMVNTCAENDDDLGKLAISSYFSSNCPERKQDVQFLSRFSQDSLSKPEIDESVTALKELGIRVGSNKSIAQEICTFNRLGYGYCPKNESTKDLVFRKADNSKEQRIGALPRMVPSNLTFLLKNEIRSDRLSYEQKKSYEDNMVVSYGLDADVKLVVSASSNGRWTKRKSNSAESMTMSFIFETRLGKLRIEEPLENHISETLAIVLKNLPDIYNDETATKFNQFFSKWGTHFITEQYIGGSIKVNCTLNTSSSSENAQRKIAGQLDNVFKQLATVAPSTDLTLSGKASNSKEMSRHSLVISGGCAQSVPSVADLTPEMFKSWIESVNEDPVELEHSTKLYPYYNLVDSESLREATLAYLDGSLHNFIEGLKVNRNVYWNQEPQGIRGLASEIIMKQLKRFNT